MISVAQSIPKTKKTPQNTGFVCTRTSVKKIPVSPTITDPSKLIATLSETDTKILNVITYWHANRGYCDSSIPQLASTVEVSRTTVNRSLDRFKELKLIYVTHRFNKSNFTYLNPYITQNYTWYIAFAKICNLLPKFVLTLSLLTGSIGGTVGGVLGRAMKSSCGTLSGNKSFFTTTTPLLDGYPTVGSGVVGVVVDKQGDGMRQFDAEKGAKCTKIARALLKRGAQLTQDEILNLLAYDDAALDRVSKAVRETKNIRNLSSFFFGLLRKFQQEMRIQPDWDMVQKVRHHGLKLVADEEIVNPSIIAAEYKPEPQNGTTGNPTYMDQVKQSMREERAAALARKPIDQSLEEKIEDHRQAIAQFEAMSGPQKTFAEIALAGFRRDLQKLLDERDGMVVTPAAPGPAEVSTPVTQQRVQEFVQTLKHVDQIKAQEKEKVLSRLNTPPAVQKSILEPSSFVIEAEYEEGQLDIEEIGDEEALYYSGQRDPFAESEGL